MKEILSKDQLDREREEWIKRTEKLAALREDAEACDYCDCQASRENDRLEEQESAYDAQQDFLEVNNVY